MLLAQEPKLLLVDEPVAGMTDARDRGDRRTAARDQPQPQRGRGRTRHGVRAQPRRAGHGAARGIGAGRRLDRPCPERSARDRSLSRALSHAVGRSGRSLLRREPGAAPGQPDRKKGRGDLHPRPQRRRQDQPAAGDFRASADPRRSDRLGGSRTDRPAAVSARPRRAGPGAAGPRDLCPADGGREPGDRVRAAAARAAPHPGRDLRAVPGAEGDAAAGAAATSPAASSSSWRSPARWSRGRGC